MASGSTKQESFAILEVLKKYTDESHRVRQQQIINLVEQETGQTHARKSIRKNLNEIIAAGYPIHFDKGWYYEHEFCPAELNLIVDSLRTASGITASQRDELIRKISHLGGDWYAKDEENTQLRPANPQFLYALDILHDAIASGKKVKFFYGDYGIDKHLHYRCRDDGNPRDYLINPYHINIAEIQDMNAFPYVLQHPWNIFLLESYVNRFSKKFKLIHKDFSKYGSYGVIVAKDSEFAYAAYDDILADVLAHSKIDLTEKKALEYLSVNNYIARKRMETLPAVLHKALLIRTSAAN